MEEEVDSTIQVNGRARDVLGLVAIAPAAVARWRQELEMFAATTRRDDLRDTSAYPRETAHEIGEGLLQMRLVFKSGETLSMKIDSAEWRWPFGSAVTRN